MSFRANIRHKSKATYLLPDSADESKILSLICGSMRIEFSMPMMNYGIITVENAIDGGFAQPLEYKIDVSDFDVTIEGLRAASLLMSQKSHPVLRVLDGEAALNFTSHMIKTDIP